MRLVLLSLLLPVVVGSAVPSIDRCVWGPPYWCSSISHARECHATNHCLQTVWKNQLIKPESTATCTYCELIVNAFRDALEDKATQAQVEAVLANVCAILPDSDTRDMCQEIIKEYVPELVQMFEKDISTDMICAALNLCSGLEDRWSPYGVKAGNNTDCSDCMKFFKDVQDSITSNETVNQLLQLINQTLCSQLGAFSGTCNDIVKQYLPIALETLASQIDPDIVCRIFGFCTAEGVQGDIMKIENIFNKRILKGALTYRSTEECVICKDFVKEMNTLMEDPSVQCDHLMDGYAPQLIKLLADKLQMDPEITCQVVSLCPSDNMKVNTVERLKKMFTHRKSKAVSTSAEECDICKDLINQIDELIKDKTNQDKVKYELENVVCPLLGGLTDECKQLVEEYSPMLFELLINELDPTTLCEAVGFCTVPSLPKLEPASMVGHGYVQGSEECTYCKYIQSFLDDILKQNGTIETIEAFLDEVCDKLPTEQLATQCKAFIAEYGQLVIELLAQQNICEDAGICPKPTVSVQKVEDGKCQLCILFVTQIEAMVSNISEADLLNDLRGICNLIPDFSATCLKYLDQYGPMIISILKSGEDPKSLCQLANACQGNNIPYMTKPIPENLPTSKASSEACEVCNLVVGVLKNDLANKSTRTEMKEGMTALCKLLPNLTPVCQGLVAVYGEKIIDLIDRKLNATEICSELNVCQSLKKQSPMLSAVLSPYNTLPLLNQVENKKAHLKVPSMECELCDTAVIMLKFLLKNKATVEEMKHALEAFCKDLPKAIQGICVTIVENYGDKIIDLIDSELNPNQICTEVGLCQGLKKRTSMVSVVMSPYNTLPLVEPVDKKKAHLKVPSMECELCDTAVIMLKFLLKNKATVEEMKHALEAFCKDLPTAVQGICVTIVENYGDKIIDEIDSELNPNQICTKVGLCQGLKKQTSMVSVVMSPYNTLPLVEPMEKKKVVKSFEKCDLCVYGINMLKSYIGKNATKEEIEKEVEVFCTKIPVAYKTECDDLIKKYGKEIVDLLVQDLDAHGICMKIGLCDKALTISEIMSPYDTLPIVQQGNLEKESATSGNDIECEACQYIMNFLDKELQDNRTEENIKAALKELCAKLPATLTSQCTHFVDEYAQTVINFLLLDLSPDEICKKLTLCPAGIKQLPQPVHVKLLKNTEESLKSTASIACVVCEFAIKELDMVLEGNRSEAAITSALDRLCSLLPDTINNECTDFVEKYNQTIIKLLVQYVDPKTICTTLRLCSAQSTSSVQILPVMVKEEVKASLQCVVCEFVMKEVKDILGKNASQAEVKMVLDKVCSVFPDTVKNECISFVNQYEPLIIQLIVSGIDPAMICTEIKLCTSKQRVQWGTFVKILPKKEEVTASLQCVVCEFVMKEVKDILGKNASQAEVKMVLDKVCSFFPDTVKNECISFVNQYEPLIIQLIVSGIDPAMICTEIKLCTSKQRVQWETFVKILPKKDMCLPCKLVMEQLKEYIKKNATTKELEELIKKICDILPDTVTVQCHDVLDEYIPAILDLIDENLNPEELCQQLGFCNATVTDKKEEDTLFYKPHRLVGQNKCTYGPAYWCANKDNAAECNAMDHCMKHVWN